MEDGYRGPGGRKGSLLILSFNAGQVRSAQGDLEDAKSAGVFTHILH